MLNLEQVELSIMQQINKLETQLTRIKGDFAHYEESERTTQKAYFLECVVDGLSSIKIKRIPTRKLQQALTEIKEAEGEQC